MYQNTFTRLAILIKFKIKKIKKIGPQATRQGQQLVEHHPQGPEVRAAGIGPASGGRWSFFWVEGSGLLLVLRHLCPLDVLNGLEVRLIHIYWFA